MAPKFLHPFGHKVVACLLTDKLREAFAIAPAPKLLTLAVTTSLKLRGLFVRYFMLPRHYPLIRSALKADEKRGNRYFTRWNKYGDSYPEGYKVEDLGPKKFVGKCPFSYNLETGAPLPASSSTIGTKSV